MLRSQFPESTIPEIHQILFDTAIDLGDEGIDSTFGHGALNLGEAMTPQGALMAEMDPQLNQRTSSLNDSGITESSVTNGVLAKAMSNQSIFVTDRYDRGFFASLARESRPVQKINKRVSEPLSHPTCPLTPGKQVSDCALTPLAQAMMSPALPMPTRS